MDPLTDWATLRGGAEQGGVHRTRSEESMLHVVAERGGVGWKRMDNR